MQYASGKVFQGKRWKGAMSGLGDRWVEPFAGGLGVFRVVAPSYARSLISDLSPIMIMWRAAKDGWEPDTSPVTRQQLKRHYDVAFSPNPTPQSVYSLHTGSVRGKARGNWSKTDNVKAGLRRFREVAKVLQQVDAEIRQCDYREVLNQCGRGDVVYLDPPYGGTNKNASFWIIPKIPFDIGEMLVLAECAVDRGAVVFVSHYEELSAEKWAVVGVHRDASPTLLGTEKQEIRISNEYLYVAGMSHKGDAE